MSRMTESAAAALDPAQAAALVQVLDLQAEWQNLKEDGRDHSTARLQGLQRTFEAFRVGLAGYAARYGADQVAEAAPGGPDRLGAWCRVMRAVVRRAAPGPGGEGPAHAVARAYRLADELAGRLGTPPVGRAPGPETRAGALAGLEAITEWCSGPAARPRADDAGQPPAYETPAAGTNPAEGWADAPTAGGRSRPAA